MELPLFDVLVFRPEAMPPVENVPATPSATSVWRDWRKLTLNPYVAYASSLSIIGPAGSRLLEASLQQVTAECLAIRSRWDAGRLLKAIMQTDHKKTQMSRRLRSDVVAGWSCSSAS